MTKNRSLPTIYLNAGHGGLHPVTGKYMTNPNDGKYYVFQDQANQIAYEGVSNRQFADRFALEATAMGLRVVKVYHPFMDMPNGARVAIANSDYLKNKPTKSLWLSFHSNAVGMLPKGASLPARGFSAWTTEGETLADLPATIILEAVKPLVERYGSICLEQKYGDGDGDFEANFDELYYSLMPAVLLENLFFTNFQDFGILRDVQYQRDLVGAVLGTVSGHLLA